MFVASSDLEWIDLLLYLYPIFLLLLVNSSHGILRGALKKGMRGFLSVTVNEFSLHLSDSSRDC